MTLTRVACVLLVALVWHPVLPAFGLSSSGHGLAAARPVGDLDQTLASVGATQVVVAMRAAAERSSLAEPSILPTVSPVSGQGERSVAMRHRSHHPARRYQRLRHPGSSHSDRPH